MSFDGRSLIVTGATGAAGRALLGHLAGASVALVVRDRDRGAEAAREANVTPCAIETADARDPAAFEAALERAARALGAVHGIAHLVGSFVLAPPSRVDATVFEEHLRVNLTSAYAVVRVAERVLRDDGGSVVLVSSAAATVGLANHEVVAAAKAGIEGLARAAAATMAARGIRVNVVAPGLVDATMTRSIFERPDALAASVELHALGRTGRGDDVANAVAFLLDEERAGWITGTVLRVDGGLASVRARARRRLERGSSSG